MALSFVKVDQVTSIAVKPNVRQFCIEAHTVDDVPLAVQFFTIDQVRASLCQRGFEMGRYVWIEWRSSRFGMKDIVTVRLDDSKWDPDEPPAERAI